MKKLEPCPLCGKMMFLKMHHERNRIVRICRVCEGILHVKGRVLGKQLSPLEKKRLARKARELHRKLKEVK